MLRDLFSLFPAYAGVILLSLLWLYASSSFPRIRGGDPGLTPVKLAEILLFPAYAGVILEKAESNELKATFPRIRGGDPAHFFVKFLTFLFSPHTRG